VREARARRDPPQVARPDGGAPLPANGRLVAAPLASVAGDAAGKRRRLVYLDIEADVGHRADRRPVQGQQAFEQEERQRPQAHGFFRAAVGSEVVDGTFGGTAGAKQVELPAQQRHVNRFRRVVVGRRAPRQVVLRMIPIVGVHRDDRVGSHAEGVRQMVRQRRLAGAGRPRDRYEVRPSHRGVSIGSSP